MKNLLRILIPVCMLSSAARVSQAAETRNAWPFFAFDNGVGRGVWSASVQADTVKKLGYDGIHYNYTNPADFRKKLDACKAADVPIYAMYIYTFVNQPDKPYDPGIKEAIRMLKGTDTIIWMTLRDGKRGEQDEQAAAIVRDIAGQAAASGLKVSIYPHAGFYVSTAEEAVRVAKVVNLPNVGVSLNLCHELFAGNSERLPRIIESVAPYLNLVSINGASPIPGKGPKAWDTLPLGSGSYDVEAFLRNLKNAGYRGPIGHQFFGVAGDDRNKLESAIRAWHETKPKALATL